MPLYTISIKKKGLQCLRIVSCEWNVKGLDGSEWLFVKSNDSMKYK